MSDDSLIIGQDLEPRRSCSQLTLYNQQRDRIVHERRLVFRVSPLKLGLWWQIQEQVPRKEVDWRKSWHSASLSRKLCHVSWKGRKVQTKTEVSSTRLCGTDCNSRFRGAGDVLEDEPSSEYFGWSPLLWICSIQQQWRAGHSFESQAVKNWWIIMSYWSYVSLVMKQ